MEQLFKVNTATNAVPLFLWTIVFFFGKKKRGEEKVAKAASYVKTLIAIY